jgi:hypothetical protein
MIVLRVNLTRQGLTQIVAVILINLRQMAANSHLATAMVQPYIVMGERGEIGPQNVAPASFAYDVTGADSANDTD